MTADTSGIQSVKHYFVDEAGDPTLFDFRGRVIVGNAGCSTHFMMGVLDVADPPALNAAMRTLHDEIRADPLLQGIESLKPERRKTARLLHAKDDEREIRDRVFRLLATQDVKFHAEVRRKSSLVAEVQRYNAISSKFRYSENWLYDKLVARLFKNLLHKADSYRVCFSSRGAKDRTRALNDALVSARKNFRDKWGVEATSPIEVIQCPSEAEYGLQAVDYFMWALQRAYSTGEDRFIRFMWPKVGLIHDIDDQRKSKTGAYYTASNPLTAAQIKEEPGDIGPAVE